VSGKDNYVCRLKKILCGLKEAPRQWYKKFESVMCEQGYKKTTSDHYVFVIKFSNDNFIIVLLYVDDILIVGKSVSKIDKLKKQLSEIIRDRQIKKLWLSQEHYVKRVLQRFHMKNAKAVRISLATHFKLCSRHNPSNEAEKNNISKVPYASTMGSLMYAMIRIRPNIAHVVGIVSRFLSNQGDKTTLMGYSNSDMIGDIDSRKSTSGYFIKFVGGAMAW
ncbi:hypothetical protein CR513_48830, partial [Mucuna pruriens]